MFAFQSKFIPYVEFCLLLKPHLFALNNTNKNCKMSVRKSGKHSLFLSFRTQYFFVLRAWAGGHTHVGSPVHTRGPDSPHMKNEDYEEGLPDYVRSKRTKSVNESDIMLCLIHA